MKIRIRYFAALREALGPQEELDCEPGLTVSQIRNRLVARGSPYADVLATHRLVRCAWNQHMCELNHALTSEGELAFFPPVTGG